MTTLSQKFFYVQITLACLLVISINSCKKETMAPEPGDGTIEVDSTGSAKPENFETYAGDIGIEIDLRDLAQKSYHFRCRRE